MGNLSKSEMRKQLNALRPASSAGLTEQLVALVQSFGVTEIASYSPLANEPDVSGFNDWVRSNGKLLLPRIERDDLSFAEGELSQGDFGLWQPTGPAIPLSQIELFVVPALAADKKGNRLGKGKGYYDRLLSKVSVPTIAVVFDHELVQAIEAEDHDREVGFVVTPKRTVRCEG